MSKSLKKEVSTEDLQVYYKNTFPFKLIVDWLDYKDGGASTFIKREFSMTLPGDIYIRYLSFENDFYFKEEVVRKLPVKLDAGAVFNANPRASKSTYDFKPVARELVFDIDISDYNDVRTCCQDSDICQKCWPFMAIGAKILNTILTKEFGFKHLLFVFSGRRGFHCWVCDYEARHLPNEARRAIADYFSIVRGGDNLVRRVELDPKSGLHPMILKSLDVIDDHFEDLMVENQDFLSNEHLVQNVVDLLPPFSGGALNDEDHRNDDKNFQNALFACKMRRMSTADCWETIKRHAINYKRRNKTKYYLEEIKLHHCFPRLDANVTRGMNHLLKLPFCIHPKTGNVCVPLDVETMHNFQLESVPNINAFSDHAKFREALQPYLDYMKKFCASLDKTPN